MTLCSAVLEVLVPKRVVLLPGDATISPLSWRLRWPPGHFGLLMPLSQQTRRVTIGIIDPHHQRQVRLLLHKIGKNEYIWNTGGPLGFFLVLPCWVIKVNGKLQQPNSGRAVNGPDPSGMKIWVLPPGKESQPAEVLVKGKWNVK